MDRKEQPIERKSEIRAQGHANRRALANKDELSVRIVERLVALPEYAESQTVMFYVDVRSEVRTRHFLPTALASEKQIVVPYCVADDLELFRLTHLDELERGTFGILEPREELRADSQRQVRPTELDLIVVPGVAFDRRGGRIGHGKGYYDKLLAHTRPDAHLIALAFECQIFDTVPMDSHDVFMETIVTEETVYRGTGR